MKNCPKCGNDKELDEFPLNKTRSDGHGGACKECQREYTKNHYNNNKKQYFIRNKRRVKEAKEFMQQIKKNGCCKKCGENRWWVLDFHHNDNKKEDVSKLLSFGIEMVKKEILKCDILCANCHRELHFFEKNTPVAQLD